MSIGSMMVADDGPIITRKVIVQGRVQGVGYRAWAAAKASALGLDGWVRNRSDGNVELMAKGSASAVAALVDACRQGPAMSRVTGISQEAAVADVDSGFTVKPTG